MSQPDRTFDPEAEQEIDFGRYVRLIATRWWLVAAGLILGAVIGYAVSLGGSQRYQATATLYLGQPYSASGNVQLQAAQTNPSTVRAIAHARHRHPRGRGEVQDEAGRVPRRHLDADRLREHLEERPDAARVAQRPDGEAEGSRPARRTRSRGGDRERISAFANQKIANFRAQVANDKQADLRDQHRAPEQRASADRQARAPAPASATFEDTRLSTASCCCRRSRSRRRRSSPAPPRSASPRAAIAIPPSSQP